MKSLKLFLIAIALALVSSVTVSAIHGTRATPFRPNVGRVPRGVPARNFSPRFQNRQFQFQGAYGYNLRSAAFIPSYGYARSFAFAPSYNYVNRVAFATPVYSYAPVASFAPSYAVGGCGQYFPTVQAAPVYSAPVYAPAYASSSCGVAAAYAPAFAPSGCGQYFPQASFNYGY